MKPYIYPQTVKLFLHRSMLRIMLAFVILTGSTQSSAQELSFKDPELVSGIEKQDGAIYRFRNVITSGGPNVDALVTINGRSSSQVKLLDIDKKSSGHNKAFHPQLTYGDNNSPAGITDWWMEFEISFVSSNNGIGDTENNKNEVKIFKSFFKGYDQQRRPVSTGWPFLKAPVNSEW